MSLIGMQLYDTSLFKKSWFCIDIIERILGHGILHNPEV